MRSTPLAGIALLAVVLAGAGCSQPAEPSAEVSTPEPDVSDGPSPGTSPNEASEAPASGVAITFDKVKSKRWGDKPFEVKAEASTGATVKYTAKGACTVTPRGGRVELKKAGDCVITATTTEGEPGEASKTIRVAPAKPKIQFAGKNIRFERPMAYALTAKVSPKIPLAFALVKSGSDPECKVSNGKLTLTQRKPDLPRNCKVQVSAATTSPNYSTPKPVVAKIHIDYPSWDVDASSPGEVDYSKVDGKVRVTVREHSGDTLGMNVFVNNGPCETWDISPERPSPPGTTTYFVTLTLPKPGENGTPAKYSCTMKVVALPDDWASSVGGTTEDQFTVTVVP